MWAILAVLVFIAIQLMLIKGALTEISIFLQEGITQRLAIANLLAERNSNAQGAQEGTTPRD